MSVIPETQKQNLCDLFRRPLKDLRISVIDRCNMRCPYCMPENTCARAEFLHPDNYLSFEEILRLIGLFTDLGIEKIRLTGGEPLLRKDLPRLIRLIRRDSCINDLALTTNGLLLKHYAKALKQAGLKRITVSCDALNQTLFDRLSGYRGSLTSVLEGIEQARRAGFSPIKINVVVQKGENDKDLLNLVRRFRTPDFILRFIEFMDVGNKNHWSDQKVVPSEQILQMIHKEYPLTALEPNHKGEVARRYAYLDGQGEIGFISAVTQPFCGDCRRGRLLADGKFLTCLFGANKIDCRSLLRQNLSDNDIRQVFVKIWQNRDDRYGEQRYSLKKASLSFKKMEMYEIGG